MSNSEQNTQDRINDSKAKARAEVLKKHEYTIKENTGQGISKNTFLVTSQEGDSFVIKEINYRDNLSLDLDTAKREISTLKNLRHGYIVAYEDSFEDKESGLFYIVMDYCTGGNLYKKMQTQRESGSFEEKEILDWFVQICLSLQHLHKNNIFHRDVKPQNVFFTEDGYINLGDFGCTKVLRGDEYGNSVVGTELYVSPEYFKKTHDSKSDIWSLGWLLQDLCMLNTWSNIIERHVLHAKSLTGITPEISENYSDDLQKLIKVMLSCDPKDRPSAEEILTKPFLKDAVKRNKKIPEALDQRFLMTIKTFDKAYNENYNDFKALVSEWEKTTDLLEEVHRKCTIGSLSGSVIGAAGGITALIGAILAPFTFGTSLIVAGVGIGVGVAGGVTGAASNITSTVRQKSIREKLEEIEQKYKNVSTPILNSLNTLRRLMRKLTQFKDFARASTINNIQMSWRLGRSTVACTAEFVTLGMLASFGRIAVQSAKVGRAVAAASGVLSGILVIADVAFIVKDSREIHQIRNQEKIDDPEKISSDVLKSIAQMRKTHKELCNVLKIIEETRNELKNMIEMARKN